MFCSLVANQQNLYQKTNNEIFKKFNKKGAIFILLIFFFGLPLFFLALLGLKSIFGEQSTVPIRRIPVC
jgi:uncharacterized membrane protein